MTPKELKRLSRSDLLEMLLELTRENEQLRREAKELRQQISQRNITIDNCGSLAEAALQLNGVFQAAQEACDQYAENIRSRSENMEAQCRQMEREAQEKCDEMISRAKEEARRILEEAQRQTELEGAKYQWLTDLLDSGEEA